MGWLKQAIRCDYKRPYADYSSQLHIGFLFRLWVASFHLAFLALCVVCLFIVYIMFYSLLIYSVFRLLFLGVRLSRMKFTYLSSGLYSLELADKSERCVDKLCSL